MRLFRHKALNEKTLGGKLRVILEKPLAVEEIVNNVKSKGKKASDFQRLSFCYRTPSSIDLLALELLADAISHECIDIEVEFVTTPPDVNRKFTDIGHGRVVESGEHQGMKAWVVDFLAARGIIAEEEVPLIGYKIDVGCPAKHIFIECGDTEPKKVFSVLFQGHPIGLLQYNSESIVWFRPRPHFQRRYASDAMNYFGLYYGNKD